jgi:hypothetical protein
MNYFQGIKESVEAQPVSKDIEFLNIDVSLVAIGVAKQAELWKLDYGEVLLTTSRSMLQKLQDRISTFEIQVASETNDLEQLKFVLNIVAEIQSLMQDIELEMMDINERYRTIVRYNIQVPAEEIYSAMGIEARWRQLYVNSRTRDLRLVDTKQQFRKLLDKSSRTIIGHVARIAILDLGPPERLKLEEGVHVLVDDAAKATALAMGIARLFYADADSQLSFSPMKLGGIICLVVDRRLHSRFLRVYDINTSELLFQAELYVNFHKNYRELNDYFYCFPHEKLLVGIQYSNVHDASCFRNLIQTYAFKCTGNLNDVVKDQKSKLGNP